MKYAGIKNKTNKKQVVHDLGGRGRQISEFVYKAKFRTVKAPHRNFVLENKTKERKRKEGENNNKK